MVLLLVMTVTKAGEDIDFQKKLLRSLRSVIATQSYRCYETDDKTIWILPLLELLEKQNWKCAICKIRDLRVERQLDHIIPVHLGGPHILSNVQWVCQPCNILKQWPDADLRPLDIDPSRLLPYDPDNDTATVPGAGRG